jgi:hypothetical protein
MSKREEKNKMRGLLTLDEHLSQLHQGLDDYGVPPNLPSIETENQYFIELKAPPESDYDLNVIKEGFVTEFNSLYPETKDLPAFLFNKIAEMELRVRKLELANNRQRFYY